MLGWEHRQYRLPRPGVCVYKCIYIERGREAHDARALVVCLHQIAEEEGGGDGGEAEVVVGQAAGQ